MSPPSRLPQVTSLFIFSDDNFILTSNQIIKYRRKNIFQCSDSIKCFITNKKLRLRHNIPYKKGLLLVPFNYPCLSLINFHLRKQHNNHKCISICQQWGLKCFVCCDQIGIWEYYVTKYHSTANRSHGEANIFITHSHFPPFWKIFKLRKNTLLSKYAPKMVYFQKKYM